MFDFGKSFFLSALRLQDERSLAKNTPVNALHAKVKLEFGVLVFVEEGNRRTQRKTLRARTRTKNKLNPHVQPGLGIEPGPQRWEVSAFTTVPSLVYKERRQTMGSCGHVAIDLDRLPTKIKPIMYKVPLQRKF